MPAVPISGFSYAMLALILRESSPNRRLCFSRDTFYGEGNKMVFVRDTKGGVYFVYVYVYF